MLVLLSPSYLASPKCKHELWRACRQPVVKLQPSQSAKANLRNCGSMKVIAPLDGTRGMYM